MNFARTIFLRTITAGARAGPRARARTFRARIGIINSEEPVDASNASPSAWKTAIQYSCIHCTMLRKRIRHYLHGIFRIYQLPPIIPICLSKAILTFLTLLCFPINDK